jgi:hypothetical protein
MSTSTCGGAPTSLGKRPRGSWEGIATSGAMPMSGISQQCGASAGDGGSGWCGAGHWGDGTPASLMPMSLDGNLARPQLTSGDLRCVRGRCRAPGRRQQLMLQASPAGAARLAAHAAGEAARDPRLPRLPACLCRYLRRRKLDMDEALDQASQDDSLWAMQENLSPEQGQQQPQKQPQTQPQQGGQPQQGQGRREGRQQGQAAAGDGPQRVFWLWQQQQIGEGEEDDEGGAAAAAGGGPQQQGGASGAAPGRQASSKGSDSSPDDGSTQTAARLLAAAEGAAPQ